jgi:hypothetical protein
MNFKILLTVNIFILVAFLGFHIFLAQGLAEEIKDLEQKRIVKYNEYVSATILSENLNRVAKLINANMNIQIGTKGKKGGKIPYSRTVFYNFITQCLRDLKITLVNFEQVEPSVKGRVKHEPYVVQILCDFFRFGELVSKFENSEKIVSLDKFSVEKRGDIYDADSGPSVSSKDLGSLKGRFERDNLKVKLNLETFRISSSRIAGAAAAAAPPGTTPAPAGMKKM